MYTEKPKPYTKKRFAKKMGITWKTIARIIDRSPEIKEELEKLGYIRNQRILTPAQVDIIYKLIVNRENEKDYFRALLRDY